MEKARRREVDTLPQREENRYLIPGKQGRDLIKFLSYYMAEESFPSQHPGHVESIYLESPEMLCYRAHKSGMPFRFKVRYRRYGGSSEGYLEIKAKKDKVTRKRRCPALFPDFWRIGMAGIVNGTLIPATERDAETGQVLLSIIEKNKMTPFVAVRYHRRAFMSCNRDIRITLDDMLETSHRTSTGWVPVIAQNQSILEIKKMIPGGGGEMLGKQIVERYELRKEKFSKYCSSVEVLGLAGSWQTDV